MITVWISIQNDSGKQLCHIPYEHYLAELNKENAVKLADGLSTHIADEIKRIEQDDEDKEIIKNNDTA